MCLSSKVKGLRDELLQNCKSAINLLEEVEKRVAQSSSDQTNTTTDSDQKNIITGSFPSATINSTVLSDKLTDGQQRQGNCISYEIIDKTLWNISMILIHGWLIQEWEHFLYGIFTEGVVYYLSCYNLGIPKTTLKLKELNPTMDIAEMHKNIAFEATESIRGYQNLLDQSCNLFKLSDFKDSETGKEMKKHIQIRHIFQHNRGKVRSRDIQRNW